MNTPVTRNAQQFKSRLLRAIRTQVQKQLGDEAGWDATKTSRVISGEAPAYLDEVLAFIAASGLAVIEAPDGETVTVAKAHYQAVLQLAGERADALRAGG